MFYNQKPIGGKSQFFSFNIFVFIFRRRFVKRVRLSALIIFSLLSDVSFRYFLVAFSFSFELKLDQFQSRKVLLIC